MASTYRLNSSSDDYLTVNYFDSKDSTIYVHKHNETSGGSGEPTEPHWEYVAAIGESQQFKELEVSGVVIHGEKLVELIGDLRPKSTATSFYSLRVNYEGRCYVRSSSVGDCLDGAKLNAFFDWSKYGVVLTKKNVAEESKWKEVAAERKRELEGCKLKLSKFIVEEDDADKQGPDETGRKKLEEEEEEKEEFICTSAKEEEEEEEGKGKISSVVGHKVMMMDYLAISVVVFYVVGLYYWGAKLLALLLPKKPTN